ncbi:rhamnogalacturonan acetylesterase [Venturia nashicola]|uniref:Rhamnogalacturonan acetylesterase n=1 Tax=Venturia nashicola TaxID=86259 RepID=A0A4Z1P3I9_9PEZI|nr:rhamnogalacturonan acetylesterase [Venturia nashicola]TLD20192.1 rhamnogalacturonan acetylesterase [Venturia nashicola]
MKSTFSLLFSSLSAAVLAGPAPAAATPKILICSDSTTANYASGPLQGWGFHLPAYVSIPVKNLAVNGRSLRSFIDEGKWKGLIDQTAPGDLVVLEMGHNDDSDLSNPRYGGRATLPGLGMETKSVKTGTGTEVVHTFGWYLRTMIADVEKKQAIPIVSGMVPRNNWVGGKLTTVRPFTETARQVAAAAKLVFVDHTKFSATALQKLGPVGAKKLFPLDNTHTNDAGAILNAETFIQAVVCAKSPLAKYLSPKGKTVKATC